MIKIELDRKPTYQPDFEVGLFHTPENKFHPFVTWLIAKQWDNETINGHYFETLEDAQKDFTNRV